MTSELSKYLTEQLGVFLNVRQQKLSYQKYNKRVFKQKSFQNNIIFYQILMLFNVIFNIIQ